MKYIIIAVDNNMHYLIPGYHTSYVDALAEIDEGIPGLGGWVKLAIVKVNDWTLYTNGGNNE